MARSATNVINFYEILPFFTIIWPYLIERFNGRFSTITQKMKGIRVRYEFLPKTETLNRVNFNDRIMVGKNSWARAGDTPSG